MAKKYLKIANDKTIYGTFSYQGLELIMKNHLK